MLFQVGLKLVPFGETLQLKSHLDLVALKMCMFCQWHKANFKDKHIYKQSRLRLGIRFFENSKLSTHLLFSR